MSVLTDKELIERLGRPKPFLTDMGPLDLSQAANLSSSLYSAASPVQASSVDLHVGKIFVPGAKPGRAGSVASPITREYTLDVGRTILITTREQFDLPDDLAGIGFTPFRIALRGVFITSVGHVDPGYQGPLRLIVVNMSKQAQSIRLGDRIATVLLFPLGQSVGKGYRDRPVQGATGQRGGTVDQETLDTMASSFLNLDDRMKDLARHEVHTAWTIPFLGIMVAVFLFMIAPISSTLLADYLNLSSFHTKTTGDIEKLQAEYLGLKGEVERLVRTGETKPLPPKGATTFRPESKP